MDRASLVHAKAHLSEIVDAAEHRGVSTIIHRHGKPSAIIVPLARRAPKRAPKSKLSQQAIDALRAEAAAYDDGSYSAVDDTRDGRR